MPVNDIIRIRRGTSSEWTAGNPTLSSGELGYDTTLKLIKVGDGTTAWSGLPYFFANSGNLISSNGSSIGINNPSPSGRINVVGSGLFSTTTGISPNALLHAYSATSGDTVLNVEGTNGSLFSIVDNLSGTLMAVNNSAGLPVLEVFSDDSVVAGRFNQNDLVVSSGGNVGMGTASPSGKLDVRGNAYVSGNVGIGTFNPATTLNVMGNFQLGTIASSQPERTGIITGYNSATLQFNCHGTWAVHQLIGTLNGGLIYTNAGSSATNTTFTIGDYYSSNGTGIIKIANGGEAIIFGRNTGYPIASIGAYEQGNNYIGGIRFKTRSSLTTTADTLIDSQGRLGINTLSPTYQLHVNGNGFIASGLTVSGLITANSGNFTDSLQLNGTGISISGHTHTASNITDFTESVQDVIGTGFILAGSGIGVSYNDAGNSFTITSQTLPTTRQTYSITASSGTFTVTAGYTAGYLDVYHNGVKLIDGSDYTATNGTTFVLTNPAVSGDVVEALSSTASVALQSLMEQAYINALNAVTNNVGGMLYLWANYR